MDTSEATRRAESLALRVKDCHTHHAFVALLAQALRRAEQDGRLAALAGDGFRSAHMAESMLEAEKLVEAFVAGLTLNVRKLTRRTQSLAKLAEAGNVRAVATRAISELLPAVDQHLEATGKAAKRLRMSLPDVRCYGSGARFGGKPEKP